MQTFDNPVADDNTEKPAVTAARTVQQAEEEEEEEEQKEQEDLPFRTLQLADGAGSARKALFSITQSSAMDGFVVFLVAITVAARVAQMPAYEKDLSPATVDLINIMDMVVLVIFTIEAILRLVALGVVGQDSYFRGSLLNVLDFVVLCWSWATVTRSKPLFRMARAVRVMIPFRNERLVIGLDAVLAFFPNIVNVVGFMLFFFCIFGTIGIQLFGGALTFRCQGPSDILNNVTTVNCPHVVTCAVGIRCVPAEGDASLYPDERVANIDLYGFDNILMAFLTQFVLTTMDEWPAISVPLISSGSANSELAWVYCAVLVVVLALIVGNLFVSVVAYSFGSHFRHDEGEASGLAKIRSLFSRIDEDGSGTIESAEIEKMAQFLHTPLTADELEEAVKQLDADQNGQVDFEEFVSWWRSKSLIAAKMRRAIIYEESLIQAAFERIDEDGSGTLDAQEIHRLAYHMGISLTPEEGKQALEEMDLAFDKPGKTPEIGFHEFSSWWLSGSSVANKIQRAVKGEERKLQKMFEMIDSSKTGNADMTAFADRGAAAFGIQIDDAMAKGILAEIGADDADFEKFTDWWKSDGEIARTIRGAQQKDEAEVTNIFDRLVKMGDVDKTGRLSTDSVSKILSTLDITVTDGEVQDLVKEMDAAGDGQVEFPEFYVWFNGGSSMAVQMRKLVKALMLKESKPWPYIPGFSEACVRLVRGKSFEIVILGVVVVNTGVMAMEKYPMSEDLSRFIRVSELIFTLVYLAEAIIKLSGLGFVPYIREKLNQMDLAIVIASVAGFFVPEMSAFASFRVVRLVIKLMRVMRMIKILAKYDAVVLLLRTSIGSSTLLFNLVIFVGFVMFLQSIVAGHLLGVCHIPDGPAGEQDIGQAGFPRTNFYYISDAVLSNFQIMTGEDWAPIMYRYMQCSGNWAAAYFVGSVLLTNFIFLDIFVAVILENFELGEDEKMVKQESNYLSKKDSETSAAISNATGVTDRRVDKMIQKGIELSDQDEDSAETFEPEVDEEKVDGNEVEDEVTGVERSCLIFDRSSGLRISAQKTVRSTVFDTVILVAIIATSLCLAIEGPPNANYLQGQDTAIFLMEVVNYIVYVIFLFEMCVRIIADGMSGDPASYWSSGWNRLDFCIVMFSTADVIISILDIDFHLFRALRVMRVLRSVKMIRMNVYMKVVFGALIECIPTVIAVCALSGLVYLSFGILGVGLFAGKYFRCDCGGDWGKPIRNCTMDNFESLNKDACIDQGGLWENPPAHFDNIFSALRTLFVCSTTEGWVDIMNNAIDATEIDQAPQRGTEPAAAIFFVLFILVGSFFINNLFIGVLVNFFGEANGSLLLTLSQKKWMQAQLLFKSADSSMLQPPEDGIRRALYNIVEASVFGYTVSALILANVIMMMFETVPMDIELIDLFETLNLVFLGIFTLEMLLKLIAYGPQGYWDDSWNQLDAGTVVISWAGMALENAGGIQALRAIRILRLLLLLKSAKGLRALMSTLVISLVPAMNITVLLVLVLFIYAVVGMHLYGGMPRGQFITDTDNFDDIIHALRFLFQIATGQDFYNAMHEMELSNQSAVFPFFGTYIVASIWVFFNLFVAVLLENFEHNFTAMQMELSIWHIDEFKRAWCQLAPPPKHETLDVKDLQQIIPQLSDPLGRVTQDRLWYKRMLFEMHGPGSTQSTCTFHEALKALYLIGHSYDGLNYEEQQIKRTQVKINSQGHAVRVMVLCIRVWCLMRKPPPEDMVAKFRRAPGDSDEIIQQRYVHALAGIRLLLLDTLTRCNKVVAGDEGRELADGV